MATNIKLSKNEMLLACNSDFILTKNEIILKTIKMFGDVSENYKKQISSYKNLPEAVFTVSPKIYRGEKYKMLPYVMLDYPRFFNKENIFSIRSFFWWGNFLSISLLLKGKYMEENFSKIINQKNDGWFFYQGNDIWENDLSNVFFQPLNKIDKAFLREQSFLKMAKKIPLSKWNESMNFFEENFVELLAMLN